VKRFLPLALLALITSLTSLPAQAQVSFPLGSRVGLEVPKGLTPSTSGPGFEDTTRKVVISVLDLPGPAFPDVERAALAVQKNSGVNEEKRESFAFRSGIGSLISFRLTAEGTTYRKWILVAGSATATTADVTAVVSFQVPEAAHDTYPEQVVRTALASVTFRPTPVEEQLSQLPYKLADLAGFRVVRAAPTGGVILTDGPRDDSNEQPNVMVSVLNGGPKEPRDRGSYAEQLLSTVPIAGMRLTNSEPMRIGGQPGYEVRAEGKDGHGNPVTVVQWLRFGTGGFLRVLAVAQKDKWDDAFPRFRAIRDGIQTR